MTSNVCLSHWLVEAVCNGETFDREVESQNPYYFQNTYEQYADSQAKLDEVAE